MENVDSLLPLKNEISCNIINFLSIYNDLKILMVSRRPIPIEDYSQIQHMVVIKEVPPLNDEEAVDLI